MPELPEVETTTRGLQKTIVGLKIIDIWTDLDTKDKRQKESVANKNYFKTFKKEVVGKKILSVERRAKNILINISSNKTILIHLKMTGHLLWGKYKFFKNKWAPVETGPLQDPFNRFVHVVFSFSNNKQLAFSDARKFGKITLLNTKISQNTKHLKNIGPEPLDQNFDFKKLKERLSKKPKGKIKTVLMDQTIVAGIGNIYSDEILWECGIHPERIITELAEKDIKNLLNATKTILKKSIKMGGDSMSDYRNIYGEKGQFQNSHKAYRKTKQKCLKTGCLGVIQRKIINGRSSHFCNIHQS
jgi:formamidopyrimidine-DNA glycosylase